MITEAINSLYETWRREDGITRADINSGCCETFADAIAALVPGAIAVWDWEEDPDQDEFTYVHCFVRHQGRYYDSECPEGTDDWRSLPCFQRYTEFRHAIVRCQIAPMPPGTGE